MTCASWEGSGRSRQGAGKHQQGDVRCAVQLERARTFSKRSARCHDVIDQQNALAAEVCRAVKCAPQILCAFRQGERSLRRGMGQAHAETGAKRHSQGAADRAREFQRLIKAAFFQTKRVQGQGDDDVHRQVACKRCQRLTKKRGNRQTMPVFEGMDQLVEGKVVTVGGGCPVVMRRVSQATAAKCPCGGRQGAARTAGARQTGKVGSTPRAERGIARGERAEQAILCQCGTGQGGGERTDDLR